MLPFLSLASWLFLVCFACYGAATLPFRTVEYAVGRRVSAVKPALSAYARAQIIAVLGNALFTPALCYVMGGLFYKAGKFTDPVAFSNSVYFWISAWFVGLLLPVQFHFSLNRRIYSADAEQTVQPKWLMYFWGANSIASATLMWLPLWLGWVSLEPSW